MKIQFINPPYTNFDGMSESAGHMMPLSFGYLASFARERLKGLDFDILDAETLGLNYDDIRERIAAYGPDIVGITAPTPAINHVFKTAEIAKELNPNITVVLGGIHPSVMPDQTISDSKAVDFLIRGEGELSFTELIEYLQDGNTKYGSIDGICFRDNGSVVKTSKRNFIKDLDTVPFPARDLYDLTLYRSAPTKKVSDDDATPILTSRGCPYDCIHCPSRNIWSGVIRYRSADNVVNEIVECVERFNLKEFNFFDDTFTIKKSRVIDICKKIMERRLGISWICFSRTNTIDDELVEYMKEAGCKKISFGLESGDQGILDTMRKKTTVEQGRRAVETVRRHNIPVHASFMLGNVGETEETIRKTEKFAKSLGLDNATFFITTPFPGTDLYDIAKDLGHVNEETSWESFAPLTNAAPIPVQKDIGKEELVRWQKKLFKSFYLRPRYMFGKLKLLFSRRGIKILSEGFRVFVRILAKS